MANPAGGKVLMLTSTLPRWPGDSTPRFVLDLASNLVGLGWDVEALAPGHEGALRDAVFEGVRVRRFGYMTPARLQTLCYGGGMLPNLRANPAKLALVPPFFTAAFSATRRALSAAKPDLVHAHWIVPMGLIAALAAPRRIPLVLTVHGSDALDLRGGPLDRLKRWVLERADVVTCNGSKTETAIAGLAPSGTAIVRIPMGAKRAEPGADHAVPLAAERLNILFAGRLIRGKGLDDLLEALARFCPAERPFLLVAGIGPEADRFRVRVDDLGLVADVRFLGGLEHGRLLALMRAVDAIVVPTRNTELVEAQGLVIAEAMSAGTPVIATSGGGADDHISNGENGLIVPPGDPNAISAALRHLIADPRSAADMARAGEAHARKGLSWRASASAFDKIYRRLTHEMPRTGC
jgi:phosphatidyl-myo-inositol dimannoside synthase